MTACWSASTAALISTKPAPHTSGICATIDGLPDRKPTTRSPTRKAELVRLRIRERAGKLMEVSEAIETIEEMASAFRTGLQGMGARCTRDRVLRRTIDDVAREILTEL